ncbi:hypothetical protein AAY72_03915 [Alishewanella sp. WH16-1]|uniref:hypothetical protein n=1 Tax=Alishewanella sp. WH16-1 TaxID=1651088 RepID=UPI00070951E8|nr:hypothetical protein [Alishewanella sp. WH16-1]KRS22325.1 hypothetical protein AAY72_03915 [Alishewanella sp. WH16-1]
MKSFSLMALATIAGCVMLVPEARAHKFSTAYMEVKNQTSQPAMLWKVSLHDLAQAQLFNTQRQSDISWQQIQDSREQLQQYITTQVQFRDAEGACSMQLAAATQWRTQQIQQQLYLLLPLTAQCQSTQGWQLHYQALFETGHNHKLLLTWQTPTLNTQAVLSSSQAVFPH